MPKKNAELERFLAVDAGLAGALPHLHAWLADDGAVRRLLIKANDDGTYLAVAAGVGADGGDVVCFGVGYGPVGALYGVDRTIQGGHWREDKYGGAG